MNLEGEPNGRGEGGDAVQLAEGLGARSLHGTGRSGRGDKVRLGKAFIN